MNNKIEQYKIGDIKALFHEAIDELIVLGVSVEYSVSPEEYNYNTIHNIPVIKSKLVLGCSGRELLSYVFYNVTEGSLLPCHSKTIDAKSVAKDIMKEYQLESGDKLIIKVGSFGCVFFKTRWLPKLSLALRFKNMFKKTSKYEIILTFRAAKQHIKE